MTEAQIRAQVVATAQKWLGAVEGGATHKSIIDTYNAHKPLARGYKVTYTDSWCATFVSAVAIVCVYTNIMPTECSCAKMIELYKARGRWKEDDSYVPAPGDLIMYDWEDSGKGDNKGAPNHVGIVCEMSGGKIKVIEGNYKDAVSYREIAVNGKYIRGYCLPDYASIAVEESAPSNGFVPYKVQITASSLNYRAGAGTNYKINGTVHKGEVYTIVEERMNGSTKWGKLKSGAGWISLKYAKKV